jgi:hypothetical protein
VSRSSRALKRRSDPSWAAETSHEKGALSHHYRTWSLSHVPVPTTPSPWDTGSKEPPLPAPSLYCLALAPPGLPSHSSQQKGPQGNHLTPSGVADTEPHPRLHLKLHTILTHSTLNPTQSSLSCMSVSVRRIIHLLRGHLCAGQKPKGLCQHPAWLMTPETTRRPCGMGNPIRPLHCHNSSPSLAQPALHMWLFLPSRQNPPALL